jgi:hypothetical protein
LTAWLTFLASQPRSAQLLAEKSNHLVLSLKDAMNRYLKTIQQCDKPAVCWYKTVCLLS